MKVSLVQADIKDGSLEANLKYFSTLLPLADKDTDWIILPEMFMTGFVTDVTLARESMDLGLNLMHSLAEKNSCTVEGSLMAESRGKYYNRHYIVGPDGSEEYYDKHYLFSLSDESEVFTPGKSRKVMTVGEFSVMPLTCYDLRFARWSLNERHDDAFLYDVLVYVASWPAARSSQWLALLRARAIENQCFVIGVNRQGTDASGLHYDGSSCIFSAKGELLQPSSSRLDTIFTYFIRKEDLISQRRKFPVSLDW